MRKMLLAACLTVLVAGALAQSKPDKVLYVYDEVNDNSKPYIAYF